MVTVRLLNIDDSGESYDVEVVTPEKKQKMPRQMAAVWYYWTVKKKGQSRDTDVVACNKCRTEYVRRAYRCVKHTSQCYNIPSAELTQAAQAVNGETGEPVQAHPDGTIDGVSMDGVVLVSVVDGDPNQLMTQEQAGQTPKKRKNKEMSEPASKVVKLTSRLKGREQSIKDLRKEIMAMQSRINDQTLQLQAKDVEYTDLRATYDQLKVDHAKLLGQLEEAEKWKVMVGDVMSMAQTVVAQSGAQLVNVPQSLTHHTQEGMEEQQHQQEISQQVEQQQV